MELKNILKDIVTREGVSIFSNQKRLSAMLSDYHISKKDINLIICILQVNSFSDFLYADKKIESYYEKKILIHNIQQEYHFSEESIEFGVDCLFYSVDKPICKRDNDSFDTLLNLQAAMRHTSLQNFNNPVISKTKKLEDILDSYKLNSKKILTTMDTRISVATNKSVIQNDFYAFKKAADEGDPYALNNLGVIYQEGLGVKKDYKKAFDFYKMAVAEGNIHDEQNLGWLYRNGYGVMQDYELAMKWYKRAANKGHAFAENNIGWLYQLGLGVDVDYEEAAKWYKSSAEKGNTFAMINLGWLYEQGLGLDKNYDTAMEFYQKASECGDMSGNNSIAYLYEMGLGADKDLEMAIKLYYSSAERGLTISQINLKRIFSTSKKNEQEAVKWHNISETLEDAYMQRSLAWMLQNGCSTKKDLNAAIKWYKKAAEQRDADSEYQLGIIYYDAKDSKDYFKEALKWLRRAAIHGNKNAQQELITINQF